MNYPQLSFPFYFNFQNHWYQFSFTWLPLCQIYPYSCTYFLLLNYSAIFFWPSRISVPLSIPVSWPSTWISCIRYFWTWSWVWDWAGTIPTHWLTIILLDPTSAGPSYCLLTFFTLFHAFTIWLIRSTCLTYSTGKSISNFLAATTLERRSYLFPQASFLPT